MTITRELIVAEARSWIGTPYRHQARAKGVAVDCVGVGIGCARALGLVAPDFDVTGYTRQPDGRTLIAECDRYMTRIDTAEMGHGDAVAVRFDSGPQHFGILVPYRHGGLAMVHAASKYSKVIETRLLFGASPLSMKLVAAYRFPGIDAWPN